MERKGKKALSRSQRCKNTLEPWAKETGGWGWVGGGWAKRLKSFGSSWTGSRGGAGHAGKLPPLKENLHQSW